MGSKWDKVSIDALKSTNRYSCVGGPFGSSLSRKHYEESGVPVIRGVNLSGDEFKDSDFVYVSVEKGESLSRNLAYPGDLVFTQRGTLGQVALIPEDALFPQYVVSQSQMKLSVNPDVADAFFLYLYFRTKATKKRIEKSAIVGGVPHINLGILKGFEVELPPLSIQKKISALCMGFDKKITLNNQINQTLEQMAQTLFKSWFVDFDPVKAKMNGEQPKGMNAPFLSKEVASLFPEKLVESELGLIPEGWEILPSENVATVAIGKTPPRKEPQWFSEDNKDVTWISIRDMGNTGTYALDSSEYLTQEAVDKFNVKVIPHNSLILSFKLTVGRVAITHGEMATNEAIAHYKLSKDARVSTNYLYSYMKQFNFDSLGSTSSIAKAVNSKIIKALPVVVPSKEVLDSFDTLVKPLFDKIKSNQMENRSLEGLRDTLLPKLLSGEIDLENVQVEQAKALTE